MVQRIQIESIEHLIKLLKDEHNDYFIALAGGCARSSKYIQYDEDNDTFYVSNEIDDSEDMYSTEEIKSSKIGEAIAKKSFYCEIYGVEETPADESKACSEPANLKPIVIPSAPLYGNFVKGDNSVSTLNYRLELYGNYMSTIIAMGEQLVRDAMEAFTEAFACDTACFDPDVEPEPDAGFFDENGYASCFVEKVWIEDGKIMLGLYVIDDSCPVTCEMEYKDVCDVDVNAIVKGILRQIESGMRDDKVVCIDSQKLD